MWGQVVLQVAKAPLVNQYARLRSDFLSYHKGSNTAKPVLAYHKTKVLPSIPWFLVSSPLLARVSRAVYLATTSLF